MATELKQPNTLIDYRSLILQIVFFSVLVRFLYFKGALDA
jgi:hypothetical protein